MYRLATLLALLAVLIAGCGDDGGDSAGEDSRPATSAVAGASEDDPGSGSATEVKAEGKAKRKDGEQKSAEEEDGEAHSDEAASSDPHEAAEEALKALPDAKRDKIIRSAVRVALAHFKLKLAGLEVENGGRKINVLITRGSACNAVAKDEPNMVVLIQEGAPIVKSASFEVAGTGQQLGYYVIGCKREKIPNGPGKVVFKHTAVGGPYTSPKFKVKGEKWALEYENAGTSMAVIVLAVGGKSKGEYFKPVGKQKRGTGRNVYKGSGTFQLKIHGAALWTVRVKDMG